MDPRDQRALAEYHQHRLVPQARYGTPQTPVRVASLDGQRALIRDLTNDHYYLAIRQPSGSVRYRPLERTPEIHVRGRVPQDRPSVPSRGTPTRTTERPFVPSPEPVQRPPANARPRQSPPPGATPRVPAAPRRTDGGPTMLRPIPPRQRASDVPPPRPAGPDSGRVDAGRYRDQLDRLDHQLRELRDQWSSRRATVRPPASARRPTITDPTDPRFVPPPPGGAELSSMQGRASRLAQERIQAREDAQRYLRRLRRVWRDLAAEVYPIQAPDPAEALRYLDEIVTTEYGVGPRWEMIQRADRERMRRALEFGDRLRRSPFAATLYAGARLSGLSHDDAQAITEDPGYQLTYRILTGLGIDDDDASEYATSVAVVVALIGLAADLRGRRRGSGSRPSPQSTSGAAPLQPNRAQRRAVEAQDRRERRRQQRAEASARRRAEEQARRARDAERRARQSEEATRRALERSRLRRVVRHPNARVQIPNLRRNYARDWGRGSGAEQDYNAEYEATQGFVGVYDPRTGETRIAPSTPNRHGAYSIPPRGWFTRGLGHGELAREMRGADWANGSGLRETDRLRAFTLVREGDGFVIRWHSQTVNGGFNRSRGPGIEPSGSLPTRLRGEVIDAVRYHTRESIRDGRDPEPP